jgi:hypothetical protein
VIDPATLLERLGIEWRPRGRMLIAVCPHPDHDDHKPSWAAWEDDAGRFRHRCLSCGFGGGPANLVMAALGLDRRAAHDFLDGTESAGPPPPLHLRVEVRHRWPPGPVKVPEEVWIGEPLSDWPAPARRYLEKRRITQVEVDRWGMGYAVDGHLAARIWIPVRDRHRVLVAWTGRSFAGGEPKYDSSTEAAAGVLLGEHLWTGLRTIVVVEGPFDAIAVDAVTRGRWAVGALRGSVAGHAIHPGHALKLADFDRVIIATDPDKAGERAATLVSGVSRWTDVRKAKLRPGEDCAKLYERDPEELALAIGYDLQSVEDRSSTPLH